MKVTIQHETLPPVGTTTDPDNHRCTAVAEGEDYLVEEFYQYVSKFGDNKRYTRKEDL